MEIQKKESNFIFGVVATILGVAVFKNVDFQTFSVRTPGVTGAACSPVSLREPWLKFVAEIIEEATLKLPDPDAWMHPARTSTEHLGFLLAEMQYLQRTYPNAVW